MKNTIVLKISSNCPKKEFDECINLIKSMGGVEFKEMTNDDVYTTNNLNQDVVVLP